MTFEDDTPLPFNIDREYKGEALANIPAEILLKWRERRFLKLGNDKRALRAYIDRNIDVLNYELNSKENG